MADDTVDVKIRADAAQATTAVNAFADATEGATDGVMHALAELAAYSQTTAARFSSAFAQMSNSARESGARVKEGIEGIESSLNGITKVFALVGSVALGAEAGRQIAELASHYEEFSEQLEHFSERIGVSVERLQALQFAAHTVGISNEAFAASLQHLSLAMTMAEGGGQRQIAIFKQLGLNVADLKAMKPDEVLMRVAQAFATHSGYAEKAAISSELFGRMAGPQLVNLLNQGEAGIGALMQKARELGVVMGEEDVEKGAALKTQMDELRAVFETMKLRVGEELAPAIVNLAKSFHDAGNDSGIFKIALEGLRVTLEDIAVFVTVLNGLLTELRIRWQGLSAQFATNSVRLDRPMLEQGKAFREAMAQNEKISDDTDAKLAEAGKREQDTIDRIVHAGAYAPYSRVSTSKLRQRQGAEADAGKPPIGAPQFGPSTAHGEAAIAAAEAAAKLATLKEALQEEARANQDAYKAGAIDLQQYYAARLEIEQRGLKGEIEAKQSELAAVEKIKPKDAAEGLQLKAKEITINGQLAVLNQKLADSGVRTAREETLALREQSDQLAKIAAQKTVALGTQQIAQEKAILDERFALREVSKAQEIASEADLENKRFELQRAELEKEQVIAQQYALNKPAELAKVNAQIEEAEATHQTKMTELAAQGAEEQMKYQTEAVQATDDAFSTMFEHIAEGHESLRKILLDFANTLQQTISKIMAKGLTENLFGAGTQGGGMMQSFMSRLFGNQGSGAAQAASGGGTTPLMGLGGGMHGAMSDWMKSAGLGGSGQMTTGTMTVGSMSIGAIPTVTVATMTVANMMSAGGGSGGGGSGIGSLMDAFGGSGGNSYGFSLAGTGAEMSAADTAGSMALPAGLGGIGSGMEGIGSLAAAYAQGTNYVPETQLAMLHRGEAVIPARYNRPSPSSLNVTNNFQLGQATDLRTQSQIATLAASSLGRAARRNG